jgi:hypothetical protein
MTAPQRSLAEHSHSEPVTDKGERDAPWRVPYRSVCIFLATGKTFTFRDAMILTDNESAIVVRYTAMSDGAIKTATFVKSNIAGVSVQEW